MSGDDLDQLLLIKEAQTEMIRVLQQRCGEWRKECERAVTKVAELAAKQAYRSVRQRSLEAELEAKDAELVRYAEIIRDLTGQWPTTQEKPA